MNEINRRIPQIKVALVRERTVSYQEQVGIGSPEDLARFARAYIGDADREHVLLLLLSAKHRIQAVHTLSVGSLDASIVSPREVFKVAVVGNALAIALVHNHPSGDPAPSDEDIAVTDRIQSAGKILGIALLDHVIVGDNGAFTSLRERGLMLN